VIDDVETRGLGLALDLSLCERVGVAAKRAALDRDVIPRLEAEVFHTSADVIRASHEIRSDS
jgi:hypothetical protein